MTMLTKRTRKLIEWHFYNYAADKEAYSERITEIAERGITANYSAIGGHSGTPGNPTEQKGLLLNDLKLTQTWDAVVRNTFTAFRFEPEYDIMKAMYIDGKKPSEIYNGGITTEPTFWRARNRWLYVAYGWAQVYGLLH